MVIVAKVTIVHSTLITVPIRKQIFLVVRFAQ